jgi:hypothetical protein
MRHRHVRMQNLVHRLICDNLYAEMSLAEPAIATRRLAAIPAADVAGYSRPMGTDEGGMPVRLKACRRELDYASRKEAAGS